MEFKSDSRLTAKESKQADLNLAITAILLGILGIVGG